MKVCKRCGGVCYYDVKTCSRCKCEMQDAKESTFRVKGATKVFIPSAEHKKAPYYVLLLEDGKGNMRIRKSYKECRIGETLKDEKADSREETVGVIGTGSMGLGIAQLALLSGCKVILRSRAKESLEMASSQMEKNLSKLMSPENKMASLKKMKFTTELKDLKGADIIIESVVEDMGVKKALFKKLDRICQKKTVFASNTSSLSIDELASGVSNPARFAGMHFFKPASKMQLVEVIKGKKTSASTVRCLAGLAKKFGKTPIVTKDAPCFIVNRVLMPYLNEAAFALEEGVASAEDIDTAAKLGLNHPMGPLELLDYIGLDVYQAIMNNLYQRTKNPKYHPPKIVEKMVRQGRLGRKSGQGFYKY